MALVFFIPAHAETPNIEPQEEVVIKGQERIESVPPILEKIAFCESGNRQFKEDGTLVRGIVNPKDVGRFQINEFYHLEKSIELGMDIYTERGNTQYALWLYENEGTRPWNWSKHCWDK